ncbi:MAG: DegV family protein [Anaerolineae bacterium]|nr:DegV family protein [Anaerolineae bacterium]
MTFNNIRIVTDSTCDIPRELVERHKIGVVPCFVNYGGNSYADDGVHLIREDFYRLMPDLRPVPKNVRLSAGNGGAGAGSRFPGSRTCGHIVCSRKIEWRV